MTSEQMFYGVSIPIVVFLISTFLSNRSLAAKFEGLAVRLDGRIDGLAVQMDGKIEALAMRLDGRIDGLAVQMDGKIEALAMRLDGRIDGLEARLDSIDGKLTVIEGDLRTFHNVTGKLEGRLDELSKH